MSTKGRYGLRLMVELAGHYGQGPMHADEIARNQDISRQYIHVLAMGLRAAGLVRTVRGQNGGYDLSRHASAISALDVVSALEGTTAPVRCVVDPSSCKRARTCVTRDVWCDVASAIDQVLSGLTIETLSARQRKRQDGSPDFCI